MSRLNLEQKKYFIFDMDGTLIDSMWVWDNLLIDFLRKYGHETPESLLREVAYMSLEQSSARVCELFDLNMTPEEICTEWTEMIYDSYAHKIKLKTGAAEYLRHLRRQGKVISLATASSAVLAEVCLKNNGIFDYFDVFAYADEAGEGKSSPAIYNLAMERMGAVPERTVLFEDIYEALKTAKSIPLDVVAVRDSAAEADRERLRRDADLYIESFFELLS